MMITTSIASGPNSTKPITTQGRRYWVEKGKVANHGLALSLGRRLRNGKNLRVKQEMPSLKESNNNYVQNTEVKTRR